MDRSKPNFFISALTNGDLEELNKVKLELYGDHSRKIENNLHKWFRTVHEVGTDYEEPTEYLNDLSSRSILHEVLEKSPPELRKKVEAVLAPYDQQFIDFTVECQVPITEDPKTDKAMFWCWRIPRLHTEAHFAHYFKTESLDKERDQPSRSFPQLTNGELEDLNAVLRKLNGNAPDKIEVSLHEWIRTAYVIELGYEDPEEFLHDISFRGRVYEVLLQCPEKLREKVEAFLAPYDRRFHDATIEVPVALLASASTDMSQFWYWRVPKFRNEARYDQYFK